MVVSERGIDASGEHAREPRLADRGAAGGVRPGARGGRARRDVGPAAVHSAGRHRRAGLAPRVAPRAAASGGAAARRHLAPPYSPLLARANTIYYCFISFYEYIISTRILFKCNNPFCDVHILSEGNRICLETFIRRYNYTVDN